MIKFDMPEVSRHVTRMEEATARYDASLAGDAPPQVDAGLASFFLEDALSTVVEVALRTLQHVDAVSALARLAGSDLIFADESMSGDLNALHNTFE